MGGGGLGLAPLFAHLFHLAGIPLLEGGQLSLGLLFFPFGPLALRLLLPVQGTPALRQGRLALGAEAVGAHLGDHLGGQVFVIRVQGGQQPPAYHVHHPGLPLAEPAHGGELAGGHDGVMVAHLAVVVHAARHGGLGQQGIGPGRVGRGHMLQGLAHLGGHVPGQVAAVGAGIGDQLMPLVEGLGDVQGLGRGQPHQPVGLPLQGGQVEQLRRRGALLLLAQLGHPPRLAPDLGAHRFGELLVHTAGLLFLRVQPQPLVIPEIGPDFVVLLGHEFPNLLVPLGDQVEGGGLHPAQGQQRPVLQAEGPGGVHAHQPIGLGPATGGDVQGVVGPVGLQAGEPLPDGRVGHGGNPQPVHRLFAPGLVVDKAKDQLPLPPAVGGADDLLHPLIQHQRLDHGVLGLGLGQHPGGQALG